MGMRNCQPQAWEKAQGFPGRSFWKRSGYKDASLTGIIMKFENRCQEKFQKSWKYYWVSVNYVLACSECLGVFGCVPDFLWIWYVFLSGRWNRSLCRIKLCGFRQLCWRGPLLCMAGTIPDFIILCIKLRAFSTAQLLLESHWLCVHWLLSCL